MIRVPKQREIDYHVNVKQLLKNTNPLLKVYVRNQFRNIKKRKHALCPDLLVKLNKPWKVYGKQINNIGIEVKLGTNFNDISKAVFDQAQKTYINETYSTEDWEGKIDLMVITTKPGLTNGFLYDKHLDQEGEKYCEGINFALERFCWKTGTGVLLIKNGFPSISIKNRRYDLNGVYKVIGKHSE